MKDYTGARFRDVTGRLFLVRRAKTYYECIPIGEVPVYGQKYFFTEDDIHKGGGLPEGSRLDPVRQTDKELRGHR